MNRAVASCSSLMIAVVLVWQPVANAQATQTTQTTQTTATAGSPPPPPPPPASLPEGVQLPSEVAVGASVSQPVKNVASSDRIAVMLNDGKRDYPASAKLDGTNVMFTLPSDLQPGRYLVRIIVNEKTVLTVPGELRVAGAPQAAPVITGISTPVYPPEQGGDRYSFTILGDHLGNQEDTTVEIAQRSIKTLAKDCSASSLVQCIHVQPHSIDVYGYTPQRFEGPVKVAVLVGSLRSEAKDLTFSHYGIRRVRVFAFLSTAIIALLVYFLVRNGVGLYRVGRQRYNAFQIFIIDKDTHSYSLSKLQLLLWTSTAVFTYTYFYLCRILIQWSSDFPDVPPGMATLLGLSAGTTVAATGLTAARGPKGAGPLSPTAADFISTGGVVSGERFQFFVWTIVGVLSFVGLVLNSDPAHLSTLPPIPDNFLALMGVSSAGYLAGKAVRRAGPVISRIDTTGTAGGKQLVLKVDGQNLEETATVRVDKKEYHPTPDQNTRRAQDGSGGSFYTHLEWTLPWEQPFDAPTHVIEVENQDGQIATSNLTLTPFRIVSVTDVKASANESSVEATVSDVIGNVDAEWTPPGVMAAVPIATDKISVAQGKVTVRLSPGQTTGVGRLALIDSAGQRANASVNVT